MIIQAKVNVSTLALSPSSLQALREKILILLCKTMGNKALVIMPILAQSV